MYCLDGGRFCAPSGKREEIEMQQSFEEKIARLEQITALLEKGEAQLSDALALFEEGTKLAAECSKLLDDAEQTVVRLTKGADGAPVESAFSAED